jgi:hypothetical protein
MVKKTSDRWAVLIGINGYHESLGRLKYSVNDCRRVAKVLTTGDDAFPADRVLVLADDETAERRPTYANIHSWLASWLAQPDEDDTVLVFFAGHGREMNGKCYLVPGDATLQTIHVTGIPVPYVQELLNRCKARQKVLILDACHSGAGRDVSTMAAPMMETLSAGKGIYTLTSCDVAELSHEWDEKKQGVFSYYLAEALSGSCPPDAHGRITAEAVYDWTFGEVRSWCAQHRCSQNPQRFSQGMGALTLRTDSRSYPSEHNRKPGVVRPDVEAAVAAPEKVESRSATLSPLYIGIEGFRDSKGEEVSTRGRNGVPMGECVVCHRPVKGAFFDLGDRASDLDGQDVSGGYSHYCIKCEGVAHKGCVKESFFFGPDKCRVCGSKLIIVAATRDDESRATPPLRIHACEQKQETASRKPTSHGTAVNSGEQIERAWVKKGLKTGWFSSETCICISTKANPEAVIVKSANTGIGNARKLQVSPDRKRLVFIGDCESGRKRLFVVNSDGSGLRMLSGAPFWRGYTPPKEVTSVVWKDNRTLMVTADVERPGVELPVEMTGPVGVDEQNGAVVLDTTKGVLTFQGRRLDVDDA